MNGEGECSQSYKKGVIRAYVKRALVVCSSWQSLHQELQHLRQMLVSNGYSNRDFGTVTSHVLSKHVSNQTHPPTNVISVFYSNTFSSSYKKDEHCIKDIIEKNCKPTSENSKIKVLIYYKNPRTCSLVMRNNLAIDSGKLSKTNVVYEYRCTFEDCAPLNTTYIGHTTCSLSRRLSLHLQHGAIKQHHMRHHQTDIDRKTIVDNTYIISQCSNLRKLKMLEAVYIRERAPIINIQSNLTSAIPLFNNSIRHKGTCHPRTSAQVTLPTPAPAPGPTLAAPTLRRSARVRAAYPQERREPDLP